MAAIRVLDKHTAELIAAGEVVERPASVVKELLENSIDAGATQVTVSIESGGVKLIEVSDNGSGIEPEDVPTAFISHATSKIAAEEDLAAIHTLGFRGEALASIASVARVELLTRTAAAEFACSYHINGGESGELEAAARGVGTTIRVRDLFYNTPARMKFLKKDSSEGTFAADVIAHLALSHPEVSFKFVREGKTQYVTPGDGQLRSAVYAVLGREFSRDLLEVSYELHEYRLYGLITPPRGCRASRSMQYFYVNGRYVRNRTMMAAMENAFKGTTMQGKFPGGVLLLDMPAELVDVNVHPAKTEIRFARENDIFDVVYHAVRLALAQPGSGERLFSFNNTQAAGTAAANRAVQATDDTQNAQIASNQINDGITKENTAKQNNFTGLSAVISGQSEPGVLKNGANNTKLEPEIQTDTSFKANDKADNADKENDADNNAADDTAAIIWDEPDEPERVVTFHSPEPSFRPAGRESQLDICPDEPEIQPLSGEPLAAWSRPAEATAAPQPRQNEQPEQLAFAGTDEPEKLTYVGEAFKTYIIAQRGDELCLIDKHAAHERQLYEQLAANYGSVPGQMLLVPVVVELSAEEKQALLDNIPLLENAGVEVDDFGGNSVVLRAVPADVEQKSLEDFVVELAAKLAQGSRDALSEQTEWVLHSIACRAAMKAGDRTSPQELMALAEKIISGEVPPFCPHGRPCVLRLTRKELEKQFGRIE